MIDMVGNQLLEKMNRSDHMQKNSNALALRPAVSYFQTKRDKKIGLYGNEHSTKIRTNKSSQILPIYQILSPSTIHNQFLNSYVTQ